MLMRAGRCMSSSQMSTETATGDMTNSPQIRGHSPLCRDMLVRDTRASTNGFRFYGGSHERHYALYILFGITGSDRASVTVRRSCGHYYGRRVYQTNSGTPRNLLNPATHQDARRYISLASCT